MAIDFMGSKYKRVIRVVFIGILIVFSFLHVTTGFVLADEGYGFYNFEEFPNIDTTWAISTLYANLIGKLLTVLPFGHMVVGMKLYCAAIFVVFTVWEYRELSKHYSEVSVFIGLMISIGLCWTPKGLLYHYISYFIFNAVALLLIKAINSGKWVWYVVAGFLLGSNVFVRFPNITECALVLVLWAYGFIKHKKVIKETLLCIAGYAVALAVGVVIIVRIWSLDAIREMLYGLFQIGTHVSEYNPRLYVLCMYYAYKIRVSFWLPFLLLGVVAYFTKRWFIQKNRIKFWIATSFEIVAFICLAVIMFVKGKFTLIYDEFSSIENWATIFLVLAIIIFVLCLFSKKVETNDKLIALAALIIIAVTPMGGNCFIFESYNNLFLIAPVFVGLLSKKINKNSIPSGKVIPYSFTCLLVIIVVFVQALGFGLEYVREDGSFSKTDYAYVPNNYRLQGVKLKKEKAEMISSLQTFLKENGLADSKAIIWGNNPGLLYVLNLDNAMSHSWIYLYSYSDDAMIAELDRIAGGYDDTDFPMIIYDKETKFETVSLSDNEADFKGRVLFTFASENGYKKAYEDEQIGVMVKEY